MKANTQIVLGVFLLGILLCLIWYFIKPRHSVSYSYEEKEGFQGIYDSYNSNEAEYQRMGKAKYNLFSDAQDTTRSNFINSIDPGAIAQASQTMKQSMVTSDPSPSIYANTLLGLEPLQSNSELAPPNMVFEEAKKCEALKARASSCKALDDPKYANCGVCIKGGTPATYENPDKHIGGLLSLPNDRLDAKSQGLPYDPTVGNCPRGYFFVDRASCERAVNRLDCKEAGESGGFQGGRTAEGVDVIGQKCAQVPKQSEDYFIYEPKNRVFNIGLRVLAPTGTGICRVYVLNASNQQIGFGENANPGTEFVVLVSGVKEDDTVTVKVAVEVPYRDKGISEVFMYSDGGSKRDVPIICQRIGATVANQSQLNAASNAGMQVCGNGWGADFYGYPSQATIPGACGLTNTRHDVPENQGGASYCFGIKPPESLNKVFKGTVNPWFASYGSKSTPSQSEQPDQWSQSGADYQAPFERAVLMQWEMMSGSANRTVAFEPTITKINNQGPSSTSKDSTGTFKTLRKFGTFVKSKEILAPRPTVNSKMMINQFWIWSNQPKDQLVKFEAQIPGIFVDTYYEEDRILGSIGPLVGNPNTSKLLRTSPCLKHGQESGKYGLECLQNLYISAGGDITNGKLVVEKGGLEQLNSIGDMDSISSHLSHLYSVATTGKDEQGNKVGSNAREHAEIINDASQKMFGFDIATPCEDITEDDNGNIVLRPKTGAVEADCLDWLWMNTGTDQSRWSGDQGRHIPNTYISINSRFSGLTSTEGTKDMRNQYPFQTCQRTGTMAPIGKNGLTNSNAVKVANTKGGVSAIQDYYNSIFQQANSPASGEQAKDQENAMQACYGLKKATSK